MKVKIRTVPVDDARLAKFVRLVLKTDKLAVVTVKDDENIVIVRTAEHQKILAVLENDIFSFYVKNIEVVQEEGEYVQLVDETESPNANGSEQKDL